MIGKNFSWLAIFSVVALHIGSMVSRYWDQATVSIFLLGSSLGFTLFIAYINRRIKEETPIFDDKKEKWGYAFSSLLSFFIVIFVTIINISSIFFHYPLDRMLVTILMEMSILLILYTVLFIPTLEKRVGYSIFFGLALFFTTAVILSQLHLNIIPIPNILAPFSDALFVLNLTLIFATVSLMFGGEVFTPVSAVRHIYWLREENQGKSLLSRRELGYLALIIGIFLFMIAVVVLTVDLPAVSPQRWEWTYMIIFFAVFILALLLLFIMLILPEKNDQLIREKFEREVLQRVGLLALSAMLSTVFIILAILTQLEMLSSIGPFAITQRNSLDFAIFSILSAIGPYSFYEYARFKKMDSMEERFPEFLRDISESRRAGMTMARAVTTSSHGNYGKLTSEIKKMAVQISWGSSFSEALCRFGDRLRTPLIQRSTSMVIKASEAGGKVSDVIDAAARDSREIKLLQDDRRMEMRMYLVIIYISFGVFLAVIAILCGTFIPQLISATEQSNGIGMMKGGGDLWEYQFIYVCTAISQALGNGLVGGVLGEGNVPAGLRHGFIMVAITYILFKVIL